MRQRRKIVALALSLLATVAVLFGGISLAFGKAGDTPDHFKTLTNNNDGTYTLSLDVKGESEKKPSHVNVIVIVDRSGSMSEDSGQAGEVTYTPAYQNGDNQYGLVNGEYLPLRHETSGWGYWTQHSYYLPDGTEYTGQRYYRTEGSQSRLEATQAAVNGLANSLLAYNTMEGNDSDTVEMALVSFATNARTDVSKTTSYSTFSGEVNDLSASGGTNWEAALDEAEGINFGDEDPTYVIFFSDGSPTFHSSNGGYNNWNRTYNVYGSGQEEEPNMERSYTQAVDDAVALATSVTPKNFYTIFAYGTDAGADYMTDLTAAAGAPATNNYSAENTAQLQAAFDEILAAIEESGFAEVEINDGTTNQVKASSGEIHELLEVDTSSFKYYKNGETWTGAPEATFANGAVEWDLSEEGVLDNGVTYTVTFDCYPSQETYDTIAKLKNGDITYDSLDSEIKKYIVDNGNGSYSLHTNTKATLDWNDTRTDIDEKAVEYDNPKPVATDAEKLTVKKEWVGANPPSGDLKMTVNMDGKAFSTVTLNSGNSWSDDSYISIGIIKNGEALPGAEGHDFSFAELDDSQYRWELDAPTVHPMLVNGELTMLVKEDADHKAPAGATKYTIGQGTYYVDNAVTNLTATNTRRSNLNLKKVVTGDNAPADALFPFTLKVKNSKADPSDSTNGDNVVWFSIQDKDGNIVKDANRVSGATAEDGDTGYYYADSNAAISVKLKAGENLRFTNLPSGSTYEFTEGDASGFEFVTAENTGENDSTFTGGKTSTGTVEKAGNLSYEVTYTNKYTPEPVKASFPVKKVIEKADGLTGPSEWSYTIDVTANGNAPEAETMTGTVNQSNDTVTFGDFTFTAPGTYTYTVKETGTVAGVKNDADAAGKTVTVKVVDKNGDGKLTATVTPTDGITFTNTYDAKGEAVLEVTKAVEGAGWPAGKKLTFTLDGKGGTLPENKTAELSAPGKATFGAINYTADDAGKTYTYTISEDGFGTGWTGSGDVTATVKVTDNGDGTLKADVTYDKNDTITNTYNAAGTADIEVTKRLTGRDWLDGETFTFTLTGNGVNESVEVSENSPVAKFPTISYTQADIDKTYTYTVSETGNLPGGITKSGDVTVTVKVTDNGNGTLKTEVTYDKNDTITNKYDATGSVELEAIKELEGRDWKEGESYTFTLKDADGNVLDEKTVSSNTKVTFEKIEYTEEDMVDENGNYVPEATLTYTIEETTKMPGGMTNSGKINVTVTLTDDGEGNITANADYTNDDTITNTYNAKGTAVLEATKAIAGAAWPAGKTITFTLAGQGGTLPETKTVTLSAPGKATFGAIKYTEADAGKTYTYTISEDGFGTGWTGSAAITATVKVIDNGDGTLKTEISYSPENATITNTYAASGTAEIQVAKVLTGRDWLDGEKFTFTLKGPDGVEIESVDVTKDSPTAKFAPIAYKESDAGQTYKYTVTETSTLPGGVTKSKDVTATVVVTDNGDGTLSTNVTYDNEGTITNTYEASGSVELEAAKELVGRDWLEGETYTFTLKDAEGNVIDEQEVSSNSTVTFDAIEYDESDAGETYTYTISETSELPGGITKSADITATVVVTDNGDGTLSTKVTYTNDDTITNTYNAKGTAVLEATKAIAGAAWPAGKTITFTLAGEGGTLPETKTVTLSAPGKATFGAITYDESDAGKTYTYTISEDGFGDGWTGSGDITATVEVIDNGDGTLSTKVTYSPENDTITNTYKASGEATLEATKMLEGRDWKDGESFTFTLLGPDGKTIEAKSATKNGPVTFAAIKYDESDAGKTYEYTIEETSELPGGVTNSGTITATVKVTDNGDGTLATEVTYDPKDATITNTYTAEGTSAEITVHKKISGYIGGQDSKGNVVDRAFEVTLTPQDGAPGKVDTRTIETSNGEGSATFDAIKYTFDDMKDESGKQLTEKVFTYTVKETAGSEAGFTYDDKEYEVKVTVTDDQNGKLAVTDITKVDESTNVNVVNEFKQKEAEVTLHVDKTIEDLSDSSQDIDLNTTFTFTLTPGEGAPGDAQTVSVATENLKGGADFGPLKFDKAGTYNYTIQEKVEGEVPEGWTYDTKEYPVVITISDDFESAELQSATEIDGNEGTTSLSITNKYQATETDATLVIKKEVVDKSGSADNATFEFTLTGDEGSPMPKTVTGTAKAGEEVKLGPITYTKVGDYGYTIKETKGGNTSAGWTNDENSYPVTVSVHDAGGHLEASVSYGEDKTNITFTNTYDPKDATATPQARKVVDDQSDSAPDEEFTFNLLDADGNVVETKTIKNGGLVKFSELTFDKVGTYNYSIQEVAGSTKGFTYDTDPHAVTITVTDPGTGQLEASVEYADATDGELVITNPYCADSTSLVVEVNKQIDGATPDKDATFTFNLSGEGEDMTTSVKGAGTASFDEIKYTKAGTHYYTVTELVEDSDSYIYDDTVFTVKVDVVDEDGTLVATPTYTAGNESVDNITFVNTFRPEVGLKVTKEITSKPANGKYYKAGETVEYKIVVTNTGKIGLTDVKVDDELTGDHWIVEKLAAGASENFTTSYKVTDKDVKAGSVLNVVTAEAENPVDPDEPLKDKDKVEVPTGSEKTPPTPPRKKVIPQTGDETPTGAMAVMTVFGAAALTAGTVLQRRKRK